MIIWMIKDTETGEHVLATKYRGTTKIVPGQNTHKSKGRTWKRKQDVISHVRHNVEFYRDNRDRLQIVGYSLNPDTHINMLDVLAVETAKLLAKD